MAKLSRNKRRKLPRKAFAAPKGKGPNKKENQYPVHDRAHAANAKDRATQMMKKGKMSRSMRNRIHAAANRVLKRGRK